VFCEPAQPLAIGIYKELVRALAPTYSRREIKYAVHWWCDRRFDYLQALAAGHQRVNLDGSPTGTFPTDEQRQIAANRRAALSQEAW
jgi:sRNA-binding protein